MANRVIIGTKKLENATTTLIKFVTQLIIPTKILDLPVKAILVCKYTTVTIMKQGMLQLQKMQQLRQLEAYFCSAGAVVHA